MFSKCECDDDTTFCFKQSLDTLSIGQSRKVVTHDPHSHKRTPIALHLQQLISHYKQYYTITYVYMHSTNQQLLIPIARFGFTIRSPLDAISPQSFKYFVRTSFAIGSLMRAFCFCSLSPKLNFTFDKICAKTTHSSVSQ